MSAAKHNELTLQDCEAFDGYIKKWQKILNLADWRIERSAKRSRHMAEVAFDNDARMAVYRIGLNFGEEEVTPASMESTALHEMLHVLLHDMFLAEPAAIEGAEHKVINVLEKLLIKGNHAA